MLKQFYFLTFTLLISALLIMTTGVTPVQAAKKTAAQKSTAALVDINSATQKELAAIKGVGTTTAKKIVAARPYKSANELSKAGLSAKAIAAIKPFVKVGQGQETDLSTAATKATTDFSKATRDLTSTVKSTSAAATKLAPGTKVNINTADQSLLEKLPEIGPVTAKAIIEGRPYNRVEDVMKINGIKEMTFNAIKDYITVK